MGYHIYVTDLSQELRSLMLALLRIKQQEGRLAPEEAELLARLKSDTAPTDAATAARPRHSGAQPA